MFRQLMKTAVLCYTVWAKVKHRAELTEAKMRLRRLEGLAVVHDLRSGAKMLSIGVFG